jgi:DNA (cytosine-5)-methyltransferase 1
MIPAADLFAGLGGFSEGARLSGRARVLFAANHWPQAIEWHHANHPTTHHECQDLAQMDMRLLPDLRDGLLLAAPACQGHSQAGQPAEKGSGGNYNPDPAKLRVKHQADRNTAWAVLAACDTARPATLVVENVVDFQGWKLFGAWCGVLRSMGYHLRTHELDARDFGLPQDRVRFILTGSLAAPIELEAPGLAPGSIADVLDADDFEGNRWADVDAKPERTRGRIRRAQSQAGARCFWNNVSESTARPLDATLPTITTQSGSQFYLIDGDRCRILNPRELARAQGFGDHYALPTNRKLAGRLIGNAIPVNLARSIVEQTAA